MRLAVPKAFVVLAAGPQPTPRPPARSSPTRASGSAPYKRIRRLEFADLPKTISGKIRRVELRALETERHGPPEEPAAPPAAAAQSAATAPRGPAEFWEEDFPDLKR